MQCAGLGQDRSLHSIILRYHMLMFQFQSHRNNKPIHSSYCNANKVFMLKLRFHLHLSCDRIKGLSKPSSQAEFQPQSAPGHQFLTHHTPEGLMRNRNRSFGLGVAKISCMNILISPVQTAAPIKTCSKTCLLVILQGRPLRLQTTSVFLLNFVFSHAHSPTSLTNPIALLFCIHPFLCITL